MFGDIDLEKVCPGKPKKIEVKDLSQVEEMTGHMSSGAGGNGGLPGWAMSAVLGAIGLVAGL
jgi:hypothetical protein